MNVLHIFSGYGGGISSLVINLIENSLPDVHQDVMAFSFAGGESFIKRLTACGAIAYTMPRPRVEGYKKFSSFLEDTMRTGHYDVIHCHIAGARMHPFKKAANKVGIKKFVVHAHTTVYENRIDAQPIIRFVGEYYNYFAADEYLTCSQMAAEYVFGKRFLKKKKHLLIPNGIKEEMFTDTLTKDQREKYNKEFGVEVGESVFIHVGRFNTQKNHAFLLDIAKKLTDDHMGFKLLLVGEGELLEEMKQKAHELELDSYVVFTGRRGDIPLLMQYADLALLPSLFEGLPTVAIECQASGTPMMIADTVTKECDMGLDLVSFYPISNTKYWIDEIKKETFSQKKKTVKEALDIVRGRNFTANAAGKLYCNELKQLMN